MILNEQLDKDHWSPPSSCYTLRLATLLCLHRNKHCMERLTSPCRNPVRYYATTSWQHVCWWLLNTNKSKARHSATTVTAQWERKWVSNTQTHTCTCLSSFWAVFQCAISSAERPQSCFWNLAFMTTWLVPYSNYRWQHTHTHSNLHALTKRHTHT